MKTRMPAELLLQRYKRDLIQRIMQMHHLADDMCGGSYGPVECQAMRKKLRQTKKMLEQLVVFTELR